MLTYKRYGLFKVNTAYKISHLRNYIDTIGNNVIFKLYVVVLTQSLLLKLRYLKLSQYGFARVCSPALIIWTLSLQAETTKETM